MEGNKSDQPKNSENPELERRIEAWDEYERRRAERSAEYVGQGISQDDAQSLSVLNDEEFGPILATANKVGMDLTRKYEIAAIKASPNIYPIENDAQRASRDNEYQIVEKITDKILSGRQIDVEDIKASSVPNYDWSSYSRRYGRYEGREMSEEEKNSEMSDRVWHSVCQYMGDWLKSRMPNIFEIGKDKLAEEVKIVLEKFIKENLKS